MNATTHQSQLLWDERCILRRLHTYSHTIDAPDIEGWLDCFTDDGVFRASGTALNAPVFEVRGQADLRTFMNRHAKRPAGLVTQHVVLQSVVDVRGSEARARSYFMVLNGEEGTTRLRMFGRYEDVLRRDAAGEWRLQDRHAVTEAAHAEAKPLSYLTKS